MRRQEITEGISEILRALEETHMLEVLRSMRESLRSKESKIGPQLLPAFKRYLFAASRFNSVANSISKIFGLDALEDPKFWTTAIGDLSASNFPEVQRNVLFVFEYLPKIAKLMRQETPADARDGTARHALFTLILPEGPEYHSKPERIAEALSGVSHLYQAVALLESLPENTLIVLSCDSGSDKSFDLLGAARVIHGLKDLILSLWDRVVFFREAQMAQRLELISASLPILDKVGELEKNQSLGPEQAELIRRRVLEGASQFLSSGSTIPEMGQRSQFDPRQLMAPEPKLLTSGGTAPEETKSVRTRRRAKGAASAGES